MRHALALTAFLAAALVTTFAQTTVTGSFAGGVVNARTGAPLPGVRVDVVNADTGARFVRRTDAEGRFQLAGLEPGNYVVKFSAPGFSTKELPQKLYALRNNNIVPFPVELEPQAAADGSGELTRVFKDGVLVSKELPAVRLRVDESFKYVGGQSFVLYDVARAEQHFFVDADSQGRIRRLYLVQFEGYLPTNKHTYQYHDNPTVNVGGLVFTADSRAVNIDAQPGPPGSDGERARAFLAGKGYRVASGEVLMQRLIHLTDETKRNELLVLYIEDLGREGFKAADFAPNGPGAARWPEMSKNLLDRAVKGLKIESGRR